MDFYFNRFVKSSCLRPFTHHNQIKSTKAKLTISENTRWSHVTFDVTFPRVMWPRSVTTSGAVDDGADVRLSCCCTTLRQNHESQNWHQHVLQCPERLFHVCDKFLVQTKSFSSVPRTVLWSIYTWGVLVFLKFWQFWSELTKTWSSGTTECGVWIGNCNVKVWKSTEHKLHNIWRSVKFQQNEHTPANSLTITIANSFELKNRNSSKRGSPSIFAMIIVIPIPEEIHNPPAIIIAITRKHSNSMRQLWLPLGVSTSGGSIPTPWGTYPSWYLTPSGIPTP